MTHNETIDSPTYVALLDALNTAHRVVTDHVVDGALPPCLDPVLDAIDQAVYATQIARGPWEQRTWADKAQ